MTRFIFTDIDGVFHDGNSKPFCWALDLWQVIASADVSLVIHSSWRHSMSLDAIRNAFPGEMRQYITGVTKGSDPFESILYYISQHQVGNFIVLEDCWERFPAGWIASGNLLPCQPGMGVSDPEILKKIREFLDTPRQTIL